MNFCEKGAKEMSDAVLRRGQIFTSALRCEDL